MRHAAISHGRQRSGRCLRRAGKHGAFSFKKAKAPAGRPGAGEARAEAAVGAAAALFLLFLVVFSYVRLYELKSEVGELKQTVVKLNEQSDALRSEYEAKIDLQQVERRARELGLHEASPLQKIYVEVAPADTTEVYTPPAERNVFERVYDAFRYVLSDLKAYFS